MGSSKLQPPHTLPESSAERLDSWKEIAAYLKRDERTVRRWEAEGLPVHRKVHKKQASIYAYRAEIDAWWHDGRKRLESVEEVGSRKRLVPWLLTGAVVSISVLAAVSLGGFRDLFRSSAPVPAIRSLAVLPLENLSKDPEQEYFAEGMTEELTTDLAQISALKVISHTSVLQYKGTRKSLPQIAHELGVDGVVEGAVERSGNRVGITVQLIDAPSDRHLWAKSYERDLRDVLTIQREVTDSITDEIKAKLTSSEKIRRSKQRTIDSKAYQDYLHGRYLLLTFDEGDARKAIAYFEEAIRNDPGYALAYAGITEANIALSQPWVGALAPRETLPRAKAAAIKALQLDDTLAEAHSALAHVVQLYDWDWRRAEKEYTAALSLNPNDAVTHFWYGEYLQAMGRNEEGFAQMQEAIELDPLNPGPVAELGTEYYMAGQYEDAVRAFRKAFELEPDYGWSHAGLGWVYTEKKMYSQAIAELERAVTVSHRSEATSLASLGRVLGEAGRKAEAREILGELKARSKNRYVSPYLVGLVQLGSGERNNAIASLEEAYANRDQWMMFLKVDPGWDKLRSDPRFKNLVQRLGLSQ
jgi:TolB-like protein/Tfp pilus assembly protein PilF